MNAVAQARLQIVILAAGTSTRLGQSKALARVHGISLLQRALRAVSLLGSPKVMVVIPPRCNRYRVESGQMKARFITNVRRSEGLSSSVRLAIARARHSRAILFMPVDLAAAQGRDLTRLTARWIAAPRRVAARRVGPLAGTPLILPRWLFSRALQVAGDSGLRELVNRLPSENRTLSVLPSMEHDVDTPQDLQNARRRWRTSSFAN